MVQFQGQSSQEYVSPPLCRLLYAIVHGIFVDPEFQNNFCQKFIQRVVKTSSMEFVGHHGKNDQFLRSNDPRVGKPIFFQFSCAIYSPQSFLVIQNSKISFIENLHGYPLRPYL